MIKTDYFTAFIISFFVNFFALAELWVFRKVIKEQYETLRNFLTRNLGFGYLIIRKPDNSVKKVFKKLRKTMKVDGGQYYLKSERVYRFDGMPTLFYNLNDSMPIDLAKLETDELWRNAKFMDNLMLNIKAGAEAEAAAGANMVFWVSVGALLCSLAAAAAAGYVVYLLTGDTSQVVLNAK